MPVGAWVALEGALEAHRAGGLACGAALVDESGTVVARDRNHAYDPPTGSDVLEGTPLAHAELNVLALVPVGRSLTEDTLWSTQQPCAMCTAALSFCGVGWVRYLAADPAFISTGDPRGGAAADPTVDHPELTEWAILANGLFLQPAIADDDHSRLVRDEAVEPETVQIARVISLMTPTGQLESLVDELWDDLTALADRRRRRLTARG